MTLYEYKMLSEDDQWDAVFSIGKFLDIFMKGNSKYVVYAINKFFVEVEWDIENDKIIGKGEFKCGKTLDKYSNVPKEI
jgi:hypothetical protein